MLLTYLEKPNDISHVINKCMQMRQYLSNWFNNGYLVGQYSLLCCTQQRLPCLGFGFFGYDLNNCFEALQNASSYLSENFNGITWIF